MIDIRKYLIEKHAGESVKGKPTEISINCPACDKGDFHFNFNVLRLKGNCFHCSYSVTDLKKFIMDLENISESAAADIIFYESIKKTAAERAVSMLSGKERIQASDDPKHHVNHDLPREFVPMIQGNIAHIPSVFAKRKYSHSTISKLNIGFCSDGKYAARIIFPILCEEKRSFYARKILDWMEPKYKNPPGALHSLLLYNYNRIPEYCEKLFVCEGCTDVCRLVDCGFDAVACSGKKISKEQISLIIAKKPGEVVAMFDGDAYKQNMKMFEKLSYSLNTSYVILPKKGGGDEYYDPDDAPKPVLEEAIKKRFKSSKIKHVLNLLGGMHG